ncbi:MULTISPECIES: universal stress protein [unclassified Variovorax]|jgi:nucleotide-binding universal stress UspA family protein|uniref:universal stress protein n=1 Tax=unclassified Variovorax TaxID=663243 RepID=UPI000D120CE3|nr:MULTISPECIES: universal stress protein [unclassified Variovorax]AVQ85091.1 universal stress protein [Variovorax sp. PMC12]QRY34713.1 universal stress protein [Variovorax sp. PDNC026]
MKLLVAVDGSKNSLRAVKYAAKLAHLLRTSSNKITLVSVHDDTGLRHARAFVGKAEVADYLRELSEKELRPARKLLKDDGIGYDMEIRTGHVAQEIIDCATAGGFDMIVLGSKGRGALADLLLGSVAQRVLANAKQPVVIVK